ncbi:unnamed protein product [Darwinula stevensoni]|uniref:Serine aminopeptidase S33 domain-containing protein n=1 Tax=Darwinula stevensoni TaxID=69355 RepID=A0A7R8WZP9_9CRUS|nr:unnamed protein product [Darwinula stevensoni]CAG0880794.1 unnamed protein product [Darwinula stevensoni]
MKVLLVEGIVGMMTMEKFLQAMRDSWHLAIREASKLDVAGVASFGCRLFCCPPCPASITAKLAFAPPRSSYTFNEDSWDPDTNTYDVVLMNVENRAAADIDRSFLWRFRGFYITSPGRGALSRIAGIMLQAPMKAPFVILISHMNASDSGDLLKFMLELSEVTGCHVATYDYNGYGMSNGWPSEKGIYRNSLDILNFVKKRLGVESGKVVLMGQSIGTAPATRIAGVEDRDVGGLILDGGFTLKTVKKVLCPVLVLHGDQDHAVPFHHAQRLVQAAPNPVEPLFIKGGGHCNLHQHRIYFQRLQDFIWEDLKAGSWCKSGKPNRLVKTDEWSKSHSSGERGFATGKISPSGAAV